VRNVEGATVKAVLGPLSEGQAGRAPLAPNHVRATPMRSATGVLTHTLFSTTILFAAVVLLTKDAKAELLQTLAPLR
jgi:hypothetical protein